MSTIPLLLFAWLVQTAVAAVVLIPLLFLTRKRLHWHRWESLSLIIPFCIWGFLVAAAESKSLANIIIEPGILGLMLGAAALARILMSKRMPEDKAGLIALFSMWAVAAAIFCAVPGFEE